MLNKNNKPLTRIEDEGWEGCVGKRHQNFMLSFLGSRARMYMYAPLNFSKCYSQCQ